MLLPSSEAVPVPARTRRDSDYQNFVPVHVVWEITLACDLKCLHCGSRAGPRRRNELTTRECLDVVDRLAALGTREISLIGGEAYLRRDWTEIIRAIRSHGIYCAIQSGGRALTEERLAAAVEAGLQGVGVSLDGLEPLHDQLRGVPGSFRNATAALRRARAAGLKTSVNTQIGPGILPYLPQLMEHIIEVGATHWQIQITVAMGNAADHPELLLQPYQVLELMPMLARLYEEGVDRGLLMVVGNNIGSFGPYEHLWRGFGDERIHWNGCSAGHTVLALEADGTVKGCPSLPTVGYAGGNIRTLPLEEIWNTRPEIHFGRMRSIDDLWGFCRTCYYAEVCRGGCTWTSHSLLGRPGNNPYCHYRALKLDEQGVRERIVKIKDAPKASFAIGEFALIQERRNSATGAYEHYSQTPAPALSSMVQIEPPTSRAHIAAGPGRIPPRLEICRGCDCYIWSGETVCPHCGARIAAMAEEYERTTTRLAELKAELERLLEAAELRSQASGPPAPG